MSTARSAAVLVILCAASLCACGDDAAPRDATTPDIDNGVCGNLLRFTGEYIDWDSGAAFCGIPGAEFQVPGGAKGTTAPNGRFDLCVADEAQILVDIKPPAAASPCAATRDTPYVLPGIAVASKAVILAGGFWSGRGFAMSRQAVDVTKAQVFVHVDGTPVAVSIAAAHGPAQARMNNTWAPGSLGQDVFFPDVDPAGGATMLTAGGAIGAGAIPLVAGKMTNVSILAK